MKLAAFPPVFEDPVRDLARALGKLEQGQGRLARKTARKRVRAALKRVINRMDAEYPPIREEPVQPPNVVFPKPPRPRTTPAERGAAFSRKMRGRDYVPVTDSALITAILEGGVRIKRPPKRSQGSTPFAPRWAVLAAKSTPGKFDPAKVRELKKSTTARRALLAAARLNGSMAPATQFASLKAGQTTIRPLSTMPPPMTYQHHVK